MFKLIATLLLSVSFQQCYCLDRDEIINEYQPLLDSRSANLSAEYEVAGSEQKVILELKQNDTLTAINLMDTQIKNLLTGIASAKTISENKPATLSCITPQEEAANLLTSDSLNTTCYQKITYPDLTEATDAINILARIPNNTITACSALDPLPSQDKLFLDCISNKILDLDQEIDILRKDFEVAKNTAIQTIVQCLANESSLLVQKINEINFEVTLCISLGG